MRRAFAIATSVFAIAGCRGDAPQVSAVPEPTTSALPIAPPNAETAGAEPVPHGTSGARPDGRRPPREHEAPPHGSPPSMKAPPPTSTSL